MEVGKCFFLSKFLDLYPVLRSSWICGGNISKIVQSAMLAQKSASGSYCSTEFLSRKLTDLVVSELGLVRRISAAAASVPDGLTATLHMASSASSLGLPKILPHPKRRVLLYFTIRHSVYFLHRA